MFSFFSDRSIDDLVSEYRALGYGTFKIAVGEAVAEGLKPIRDAYEGMSDAEVGEVMASSAARARKMAERTMISVRERVGLA
jgi:tryptophanyl-tRNA synthetase